MPHPERDLWLWLHPGSTHLAVVLLLAFICVFISTNLAANKHAVAYIYLEWGRLCFVIFGN